MTIERCRNEAVVRSRAPQHLAASALAYGQSVVLVRPLLSTERAALESLGWKVHVTDSNGLQLAPRTSIGFHRFSDETA
jgi:hypothetical protein